nr:hypothetical protein [Tanacetum cinerariifolium]
MSFVPILPLFVEFKKDDRQIVEKRKKSTISGLSLDDCMKVVKEIENGHVEEMEVEWWFDQEINDEGEEDEEGERVSISLLSLRIYSFREIGVEFMTFMRRVLMDSRGNIGRGRDVLRWRGRIKMK